MRTRNPVLYVGYIIYTTFSITLSVNVYKLAPDYPFKHNLSQK